MIKINKKLELDAEKKKKYSLSNADIGKKNIKSLEKSINNLNCRLSAIKTKIKESEDPICPVCMGEPDEDNSVMVDCCGAVFCFDCLALTSNKDKCLYCFQKISKKSMHVMTKKNLKKNNKKTKEKINALLEIINSKKNGKILVFANYFETFEKIQVELKNNKITYAILKGENKGKLIENFKTGKIKVLMLNAANFGAGLNLQEATDVVIYHRFTKETEEQVIGRAQRLGRKDKLNVYYLIHENENVAFSNTFVHEDINYEKFLNENNEE
jgi:SNF2 family DNA or RNA helicase